MNEGFPKKEFIDHNETTSFDKIEENLNTFEKLLKVHKVLRKSI
jgi:hypothetical protein